MTVHELDPPQNITAVVTLQNVTEDAGEYNCIAAVIDNSGSADLASDLNVSVYPFFTDLPDTRIVLTNNTNPNMECVAEGFPVPTVRLYRIMDTDGSISSALVEEGSDGSVAVFEEPINFGDSGEYQCVIESYPSLNHSFLIQCESVLRHR